MAVRHVKCREWMASSCCVEFRARLLALAGNAIVAMVIVLALVFATAVGCEAGEPAADRSRIEKTVRLVGAAVRDAIALVRSPDRRLIGAAAYWIFDAAVLWAMLHAFGSPPSLPVVALAYFVGQVANTLPLPGAVSGGIALGRTSRVTTHHHPSPRSRAASTNSRLTMFIATDLASRNTLVESRMAIVMMSTGSAVPSTERTTNAKISVGMESKRSTRRDSA